VHGTFYAVEDLRAKLWCAENDKDWEIWDNEQHCTRKQFRLATRQLKRYCPPS
jgi:hypothetical protein